MRRSIINTAYGSLQFWDGRAADLEEQALGPIQNPIEMTMTLDQVVERLNKIAGYKEQFQAVFGTDVTSEGIALAIAAYERTVLSGDAPYDRFKAGRQRGAVGVGTARVEIVHGEGASAVRATAARTFPTAGSTISE